MAVVIASAIIPTVIVQVWFQPREVDLRKEEFTYNGSAEHFLHIPDE